MPQVKGVVGLDLKALAQLHRQVAAALLAACGLMLRQSLHSFEFPIASGKCYIFNSYLRKQDMRYSLFFHKNQLLGWLCASSKK